MNDLNQKLGLGPPKEKEKEPEPVEDAKPLEDARKGRARGPQRRAPAKSPAAVAKPSPLAFSMSAPRSLWTIDDEDLLDVSSHDSAAAETSSKVEDASAAVGVSSEKEEQINNSTPADAPLPPTINTTEHEPEADLDSEKRAESDTKAFAASILANTAGELAEPTLGTPTQEKSNPLSKNVTPETRPQSTKDDVDSGAVLSKHTTASSGQASGPELERENPDHMTDAIPASKQTTASTEGGTVPLEKSPTQEPRQVSLGEKLLQPREASIGTQVQTEEPGQASAAEV